MVGSYRIDVGMTLEIRRQGTRLFARATGQEAFPVYFTAENRLETRTAPIVLEVGREETRVPAVVLIQGGRHRCPRIE